MEVSVSTKGAIAESLPTHYDVDLAVMDVKLAIEIDGSSHLSRLWKYLDRRKTEVLAQLGWSVLRFKNREVLADLSGVLEKITSTISQLRSLTPT